MRVNFTKMSGAGNDFIVLDGRKGNLRQIDAHVIQWLCQRKTGVGADGLILIRPDTEADFFMAYYNKDGKEAELCANGARCAVLFAHQSHPRRNDFRFRSMAGCHRGKIVGGGNRGLVEIDIPPPSETLLDGRLELDEGSFAYAFIVVGVPHVVMLRETGLDELDVPRLGRTIREHAQFRPRGTNVNFIQVSSRSSLAIRTYERGVEEETLACGTGSTASSIIATMWGLTQPPVECHTRGGEVLLVSFEYEARTRSVSSVHLLGGARVTFEGWVNI